jgi:hypothetical protein
MTAFDEAWDRERSAWLEGHGGEEYGYAIEGDEGQYLRRVWEEAFYDLNDVWSWYSYRLQPAPPDEWAHLSFAQFDGENGRTAVFFVGMSAMVVHGQSIKLLCGGGA